MLSRRALLIATVLGATIASDGVASQDYPERPVTVVMPFAPGGLGTTVATLLGNELAERLGQNFVVEHREGAGGAIGFQYVARAAPDGYTLLLGTISTSTILPAMRKLPFDVKADFQPLGQVASSASIVFVPSSSDIRTLDELIAFGKRDGSNVTCAHAGVGSSQHLSCVLLNETVGAHFTPIAYTGSSPALVGLAGGETTMMFGPPSGIDFVKDGSLRAIAVTTEKRLESLPEVPTAIEAGVVDVTIDNWWALWAPVGVPEDVVTKISAALIDISKTEEWLEALEKLRMLPASDPSTERLQALISLELERWRPIVEASGAVQQ
ncbi:tripartite tricarboxylate transporter substrate binding protein [Brucella sp. 21LCYQ03]|nr:tripartite tricarboxylate transporter substrate binding protein [Brucella sp. 21LCYQ03]